MELSLYKKDVFEKYKSNSQRIRILTENWFVSHMYCPFCLKGKIIQFPPNNKTGDFYCQNCKNIYELKSSKTNFTQKVLDGEYNTMISQIKQNKSPNFSFLNYSENDWIVKNLFITPKSFVSLSIIEKRKPLSENAIRAGWTGCNILLKRIPEEGRIQIIKNEKIIPIEIVSKLINKIYFLSNKNYEFRGWTSDILNCIEKLTKKEFNLNEIYKFENYLKEIHPHNNNIKAKIRQQLQILRDNNLIMFHGEGRYSLIK